MITADPSVLLDEAAALLDPAHIDAVVRILTAAGWDAGDAREAAHDVLAANLVAAAEDDEED